MHGSRVDAGGRVSDFWTIGVSSGQRWPVQEDQAVPELEGSNILPERGSLVLCGGGEGS